MAKIIKNTTGSSILHTNSGINFPANSSTELGTQDISRVLDSQTLSLISSGSFVYNDGSSDVTDPAKAWSYLTGEQVFHTDSENAQFFLPKYAPAGWSYEAHPIEFKTSTLSSIYSKDESLNDYGFSTIKFYDTMGAELTTQNDIDANCVKTVVEWEPTVDYLIIAGRMFWVDTITTDVRVWVIGVPNLTYAQGGSRRFVGGVNLKFIKEKSGLTTDGRAPKRLNYNATYHTSKFKYIIRHAAGDKIDFQLIHDIYKA